MQHSNILLLGQIAIAQPGGVLGHYHFEKKIIVAISANQMGSLQNAVVAMLVKCVLNSK